MDNKNASGQEAAARVPRSETDNREASGRWRDEAAENYDQAKTGEVERKQAFQVMAEPYRKCLCGGDVHRVAEVRIHSVGGSDMIGGDVYHDVCEEPLAVCRACGLTYVNPNLLVEINERIIEARKS